MPALERVAWMQSLYAASLAVFLGWHVAAAVRARRTITGVTEDRHTNELIIAAAVSSVVAGFALAVVVSFGRIGNGDGALAAGLALVWIGLACREWARSELGRFYRPVVAIDSDHQVIDSGPYRYIRHPFYSGLLLGMFGLGVAQGSWLSAAVYILLPTPAIVWRIRVEEQAMLHRLGDRYERYARGRARLVPFIW